MKARPLDLISFSKPSIPKPNKWPCKLDNGVEEKLNIQKGASVGPGCTKPHLGQIGHFKLNSTMAATS